MLWTIPCCSNKDGYGGSPIWKQHLADWPDEHDWRMNRLRLHVVAYIQDARTGEILQGAIVGGTTWDDGKPVELH